MSNINCSNHSVVGKANLLKQMKNSIQTLILVYLAVERLPKLVNFHGKLK